MNTPSPVSLNRRWAKALEQDTASVARDLMNLGLSPNDVIDGDVILAAGAPAAVRPKSLWRWAARADGYAALDALAPGLEAQWAMRPGRRQTLFIDGFEQPLHQRPTMVVRLHDASPGIMPTRVDGWALDEALIWQGDRSVHKLVWLNQQMQTWAGSMDWDAQAPAPWGGSVGDRTAFLRQGWMHSLLTAGDHGAWSLMAMERLGIVAPDEWDLPLRNADAGPPVTLLQQAARLGQPDLVRSLLQQKADPNLASTEDSTPLGFITAHLLQSPEQKVPELVAAWIDLVAAGADLGVPVPATSTRPSAVYHPEPGEWIETPPNNRWVGRPVEEAIQAWVNAQQTQLQDVPATTPVDGFRRTMMSMELAGRLSRALEAHQLRAVWNAERARQPSIGTP